MMRMKIFAFLVLVAASFAAQEVNLGYDGPLFTTNTPSSMSDVYVDPYMRFTNTLRLSVDPSVRIIYGGPASDLQNNAIICEGDVTAQMETNGIWARGGNLGQNVIIYQCTPEANTRVQGNQDIYWSTSTYDTFVGEEICDQGESCWGREGGGFVSQPADYWDTGTWHYGRNSFSKVVCKGTSSLLRGTTLLNSKVIDRSPASHTAAYARGTHSFTGNMEVDGCMAIVRYPDCPPPYVGREKIYSRTRAQFGTGAPEYSASVPATMSLRVVTNDDLMCRAGIASVTPSPLNVSPGGMQTATVVVNNNCPASEPLCQPITVTGITVSDGFRFTYFMLPGGSYTALPGRSVSIPGSLTAPEYLDCPTRLTFTATYTCTGCEDSFSGTPVTVNVPFECPPPDLNLTNLRPRFNPDFGSRIDLRTGDDLDLEVITWNNGFTPGNPGETCVNIGRFITASPGIGSPPITIWLDEVPPERHSYDAILPGGEVNHGSVDFSCTPEMENKTYTLIAHVDCMPPPFGATPEMNEEDNRETRLISCGPRETNITEDGDKYSCDIIPPSQTGYPMGEYSFRATCPPEGNPDNLCGGGDISWSSHSSNVTYTSETYYDIYEILVGGSSGPGIVDITAKVKYPDGNATCSAQLVVPYVPCEDFL